MHSALMISDLARRFAVGRQNSCIPAIWRRDSHASVKWGPSIRATTLYCSTRRMPICRVQPLEKESENPTQGNPSNSDSSSNNHGCDSIDKEDLNIGTSFDWGWLPTFPHAFVAVISNLLFGYHIGVMNGPITSIAHELGFEGDQLLQGLVISISVAAAFLGSFSTSIVADRIGRRRTLQLNALPFIVGALIRCLPQSIGVHWELCLNLQHVWE